MPQPGVMLPPGAAAMLQELALRDWRSEAGYCKSCGHKQPHDNAAEEHRKGCTRAGMIQRAMRGPRIKLKPEVIPQPGEAYVCPVDYQQACDWLKRHRVKILGEVIDDRHHVLITYKQQKALVQVRKPKALNLTDQRRATQEAICRAVEMLVRGTGDG